MSHHSHTTYKTHGFFQSILSALWKTIQSHSNLLWDFYEKCSVFFEPKPKVKKPGAKGKKSKSKKKPRVENDVISYCITHFIASVCFSGGGKLGSFRCTWSVIIVIWAKEESQEAGIKEKREEWEKEVEYWECKFVLCHKFILQYLLLSSR